jgi:hypothetical protein
METVGKVARDLLLNNNKNDHTVEEQMKEQLSDYEINLFETITAGKSVYTGPFYLVVITKKERLMENVLRHYFFHRATCPTPDYDQAVYRYTPSDESIEFLWVIPAKDVCYHLRDNALVVDQKERELLKYVLEFFDDTLMIKAKRLNGENLLTPMLEKGAL